MKLSNKKLIADLLIHIEYAQQHIKAVDNACSFINSRNHGNSVISVGVLRESLIQVELEAWRSIFMWGLTLDGVDRDKIKVMAHERFLNDSTSVGHWLSSDFATPGGWYSKDEDDFRVMAKEYFSSQSG